MTTPDDVKRARMLRKRHKQERQAVIFGVLIAFLAVSGLGALAVYTGTVDPPFERGFSTPAAKEDEAHPQACLPEGTLPVPSGEILVNVFNATDRGGLAGVAGERLAERGFAVGATGNATIDLASVRISFGAAGLAQAYTVAAHFAESDLYYDAREDASVDVTLGDTFEALSEEIALDPAIAMTSVEGCVALEEIAPAELPTEEPAPEDQAPAEGDPPVEPAPVDPAA